MLKGFKTIFGIFDVRIFFGICDFSGKLVKLKVVACLSALCNLRRLLRKLSVYSRTAMCMQCIGQSEAYNQYNYTCFG
jgi:hypothetical protein